MPDNITSIWPGSKLDWSSPKVQIQLYVELPFWLMMHEGNFDIKYEETMLKIAVVHSCEEIQQTTTHFKNRASTVFIARPDERIPVHIQNLIDRSQNGCSAHIHRTTLIIETFLHQSVLNCMTGSTLDRSQAMQYLIAMAVGHLPLVNVLISAYRRAANDPFVQEVTEATVPIWFVRYQDDFLRVPVYPYADSEHCPNLPTDDGTLERVNLVTAEELVEFLALEETPGEFILLDAWSYFYAGRFSDAIRGFVSAIEVLLEAKFSAILKQHGNSDKMVQTDLKATANKFTTRLNNYLQHSKRTIPGPLLSWVPYITGVRLRDELNQTRELRHKIVHEGHRMSPVAHGPMLRAAETMTWLFDWLENNERSSKNRFKLYQLKGFLKGRILFGVEYTPDGVKVLERQKRPLTEDDDEYMADDQLWGKHSRSLYGQEKDIELFVKMSLSCIRTDSTDILRVFMDKSDSTIVDIQILPPTPGVLPERFTCCLDDLTTAIFVIELDGLLTISDLNGVLIRLLQLRVKLCGKRIHGICIVNHQQHLAPTCREIYRTLDNDLTVLLSSCDLSLVFASDLARYIRGARDHKWPLTSIRDGMKGTGYISCWPPNSTYVGEVVKVFPKQQVLGVNIVANPSVAENDQIFVHSGTGFKPVTINSIEVNKNAVKSVSKALAGLKVDCDVNHVTEGAFVFRVNSLSSETST